MTDTIGTPRQDITPAVDAATLRRMLYYMKLHRAFEDRIEVIYRQGKLAGPIFTGRGQEAVGVGSAILAEKDDVIFPTHRDLGAFLIKGMTPEAVFLQYFGRRTGPMRGRDGNTHMGDWKLGIGAFVSHMADTIPVAAGVALAFKTRHQKHVVLCYHGDGASSRGDWHEGLNIAAVLGLPVVYICVNNQYAYSTPLRKQMAVAGVAERAAGYGMPVESVDGNDVLAVHAATHDAIARARAGAGPSFIECWTYRMTGHGAHDDASYVPRSFFEEGKQKDPIARLTNLVLDERILTPLELKALEDGITREIDEAAAKGEAGPLPDGPDTLLGVYAD
jgi:TPP-dependent pyruvate/acetoin dehydrogenase alpha subunit